MTYADALASCRRLIGSRIRQCLRATHAHLAVDADDLHQAARVGVWYAWRSYDATRGASFATWAEKWIRAYVEREAWGVHHARRGPKATLRNNTVSLEMMLRGRHADGRKAVLADVVPDPKPSPERILADRQRLAIARSVLLAKSPRGARFDVRAAMRRHLNGEGLRSIAADVGVSFQAVSLHVTKRREFARALVEAA